MRTGEAIGAHFSKFDLAVKVWRIPGQRMKTTQEHWVPLCDRAVEIVREMAAIRRGAYVFPGQNPEMPLSNMAMLMALRRCGRASPHMVLGARFGIGRVKKRRIRMIFARQR